MTKISLTYIMLALCTMMMQGCYYARGVQTERITDKVVQHNLADMKRHNRLTSLKPYADSVPAWQAGMRIYVTDDRAKLMLSPSAQYNADTLHLGGKVLTYQGYSTGSVLDNNEDLILRFSDASGNEYSLPTHRTLKQFTATTTLPFLIDLDMVRHYGEQLEGQLIYVKTNIWYDNATEEMIDGRKFVQVRVDSVLPGNKVLPLRIVFTALDKNHQAMLWIDNNSALATTRDFDNLFALSDPHDNYPAISDETWQNIIDGKVAVGMTKDECRLSKGSPRNIARNPDQNGLRELWQYDGGSYLLFVDGVLQSFR